MIGKRDAGRRIGVSSGKGNLRTLTISRDGFKAASTRIHERGIEGFQRCLGRSDRTGQGLRNASALRELRQRVPHIPLIIDAGIGRPSHACQVMEWGFDGVLLNTAVSRALHPVDMASAFAAAVRAGRSAFLAGPMIVQELAVPSTPELGRPFSADSPESNHFFSVSRRQQA